MSAVAITVSAPTPSSAVSRPGTEERLDAARIVGGDGDPRDRVDEQDDVGAGLGPAGGVPDGELDEAQLLARSHVGGRDRELGSGGGLAPGGDLLGTLVDEQDDELEVVAAGERRGDRAQQRRPARAGGGLDQDPLAMGGGAEQVEGAKRDDVRPRGAPSAGGSSIRRVGCTGVASARRRRSPPGSTPLIVSTWISAG